MRLVTLQECCAAEVGATLARQSLAVRRRGFFRNAGKKSAPSVPKNRQKRQTLRLSRVSVLAHMVPRVPAMDGANMPAAHLDDDHGPTRVSVVLAERGGWLLLVERDGQVVATEHCDDWHRVERRRRLLEARTPHRLARAAAALLVMVVAASGPVAAQTPPAALVPEPTIITKALDFATEFSGGDTASVKNGFYPEFGHMITGAGWISFGPGYRHHLFAHRAVVDLSAAISWRRYKTAQARFDFSSLAGDHLTIGSQVPWQDLTQVAYYGAGPDSIKTDESDYRLKGSNVVLYGSARSTRALSLTGRFGWLSRIGLSSSTGFFDGDRPDAMERFPDEPGAQLERQPSFLHADVSVAADTRDHAGHPSRGGLYRAGWVGFTDHGSDAFGFARYELEGAHFVAVLAGRSVLAVHGWGVFSMTSDDREVPFYLLPSLGGHNTIRSYANYRFHDRDMLVVNVESRWALMPHVDVARFVDAGNVARRAADLNLARTGYGAGVRLHSDSSTFARFDVAKGHEGWRFDFRLNDPFRLGRLTRRTAAAPFVP
jgi:hypothetical protein